ncbi:MAG: PAS domain-containing protein [Alphaproteobacteria bacterium]|nr:PAS domain-containing protein [Alphaproteobacteria bacterium]
MSVDVVEHPTNQLLIDLAALWESKCVDGKLPGRADFSPEVLRRWLGHVIMLDVIDGGRDFRYRLIGTHITRMLNRDYTGKLVSECEYDDRANVEDSFRLPLQRRKPVFRTGRATWQSSVDAMPYDSVHMPLATDGENIDMLLGAIEFHLHL